ncbi:MAG: flagellin [Alphaproteobacteria bacterium]|nr:flagellin [Alphaproteobacteria bacterium]MCW5750069.1 flagellin [Alphaproteobacteria bacterium]
MVLSVNTNVSSLAAIRQLNLTNRQLEQVQQRINSGLKVSSSKDDASTFAIAQGLRSDINSFKAIAEAISFGQATANVALRAAETISNTLNTIKQKVVAAQAANVDRRAIQNDIVAMTNQIQAIVDAAQFNGINLLNDTDGDLTVLASLNRLDAQTAPEPYYITVQRENLTTSGGLGIAGLNIDNGFARLRASSDLAFATADTVTFTVDGTDYTFEFVDDPAVDGLTNAGNIAVDIDPAGSTQANLAALNAKLQERGFSASYNADGDIIVTHSAGSITAFAESFATGSLENADQVAFPTVIAAGDTQQALVAIEDAITLVKDSLARLGTSLRQLETQGDFVKALQDTLTEGVGVLVDADLAEESANLQAVQTRQQLGLQALSIANQAPSAVLQLFRG